MDASRFDTWTRRRFGLAAGGTAALLGLTHLGEATANEKKKKCKKSEKRCGKKCIKGTCCPGKKCGGEDCQCTRTVEGKAFCRAADARLGAICVGAGLCPLCSGSDECVDSDFFGLVQWLPPCGFEP